LAWPLVDDEDDAARQAAAFNRDAQDDTSINEARWQDNMWNKHQPKE